MFVRTRLSAPRQASGNFSTWAPRGIHGLTVRESVALVVAGRPFMLGRPSHERLLWLAVGDQRRIRCGADR